MKKVIKSVVVAVIMLSTLVAYGSTTGGRIPAGAYFSGEIVLTFSGRTVTTDRNHELRGLYISPLNVERGIDYERVFMADWGVYDYRRLTNRRFNHVTMGNILIIYNECAAIKFMFALDGNNLILFRYETTGHGGGFFSSQGQVFTRR